MKTKIMTSAIMATALMAGAANADTVLATEPFVRGGVAHAIAAAAAHTDAAVAGRATAADVAAAVADRATAADVAAAIAAASVNYATAAQGILATTAVQPADLATLVADVSGMASLQPAGIINNITVIGAAGQFVDSGVAITDVASATAVGTLLDGKQDNIVGGADAGRIMQATAAGWRWVATTSDVFIE